MRQQRQPGTKLEKLIAILFSPRRVRYNVAILCGAVAIALTHWLAMTGGARLGLGESTPVGVLVAPALGGLFTGGVLGYAKRPAYMDGAAGTYSAFLGVLTLIIALVAARTAGELPASGAGFESFGPWSLVFFFLLVGGFNVLVCFPVTFIVIFVVRTAMPNNHNKYGWADDQDLEYVTPGPPPSRSKGVSTARSRFGSAPVRYSKVPQRHRYRREE